MGWKKRSTFTGARDVTSLAPDIGAGRVIVYRSGSAVTFALDSASFDASGWRPLLALPNGLRPPTTIRQGLSSGDAGDQIAFYETGGVYINMKPGVARREVISFGTANGWPTTLPGVAA